MVKTFSELDKSQSSVFNKILFVTTFWSLGYWNRKPVQRDALTMKYHLKMHLQLCIFHFSHTIVNYTSARPCRKEVGCQGDGKGERKERNFHRTKELQETDTTLLEAIPSPLNIFDCIQTYQNPNKGHFSQLKYEPSANLTATRQKQRKAEWNHLTVVLNHELPLRAHRGGSLTQTHAQYPAHC